MKHLCSLILIFLGFISIPAQVITPQIKELCNKSKSIYYQNNKIIIRISDEYETKYELDPYTGEICLHKEGEKSVFTTDETVCETMRFLRAFYEDCYGVDEMSMVAVKSNDNHKWGFVSCDGKKKIKCKYLIVTPFGKDGLAFVKDGKKYLYINTDGQPIIKNVPYLDSWGFGNVIYDKINYDYIMRFSNVERFSEGLAFVPSPKMVKRNNSIYFDCINTQGDIVFSMKGGMYPRYPFSEGLAVVEKYNYDIVNHENTKTGYGYINNKGDIVIPCDFDRALPFMGNYAIVEIWKRNAKGQIRILYGIIDKQGNCTLSIEHKNIETDCYYDLYK